jgi:hypothetical protein
MGAEVLGRWKLETMPKRQTPLPFSNISSQYNS